MKPIERAMMFAFICAATLLSSSRCGRDRSASIARGSSSEHADLAHRCHASVEAAAHGISAGLRRQGPIARSPSAALRLVRHGAAWYLGTSVLCMRGLPCCTLLLLAMHACRMGRWALVRMWASNEDARGQCCRCVLHRRRGSVTVFVEMA